MCLGEFIQLKSILNLFFVPPVQANIILCQSIVSLAGMKRRISCFFVWDYGLFASIVDSGYGFRFCLLLQFTRHVACSVARTELFDSPVSWCLS